MRPLLIFYLVISIVNLLVYPLILEKRGIALLQVVTLEDFTQESLPAKAVIPLEKGEWV